MTRQEFTEMTGVKVSDKEYAAIETVYMASDLNKDEFCAMWRKMNRSRVQAAKEAAKEAKKEEAAMGIIYEVYDRLKRTASHIRPQLAYDFLSEKEREALSRFNIGVWDYAWGHEKDTHTLHYEITKLIEERARA